LVQTEFFPIGLGLVNKLSSIFGWLRLRLAVSAKLGLPTSRPAFCFLAGLVLAQPKTKPNFFTSPYDSFPQMEGVFYFLDKAIWRKL